MRVTVSDVAVKLGVSKIDASGFIRTLTQTNIAKEVDSVKSSSGKGKPSKVYEVPEKIEISFG